MNPRTAKQQTSAGKWPLVAFFGFGALVAFLAASASRTALASPAAVARSVASDTEIADDLNLDLDGMQKVKAAFQSGDLPAARQAYLAYRRTISPAKWRIMPSAMPAKPVAGDDTIGDEILRHHIRNSFYHSLPLEGDMGADFDWTHNPVDAKSPQFTDEWTYCTISRTQFWEQLADAYWKTHDEKYAAEWVRELDDFAAKNPRTAVVPKGKPSLWRTLDAAIRMHDSWPYAYFHFLNSPAFTPEAQWLYLKELHEHAILLEGGLSNRERTGNWVTTETFGLFTIAVLFPEFKESAHWRELCLGRIKTELARMVPPDGMEVELTPSYHNVAVDGFRGPLLLARLNQIALPSDLQSKITSMYRALVMVMEQNGDTVCTNDSSPTNALWTARRGLELTDDPLLKWAISGGKEGAGLPDSTSLPYAGFYAMRSGWKPDDMFLFFRAGPTGVGHEHEDMLEVVLKRWGKTLLLDPGSAPYDHSDWRRFAIGTESHNTIVIDGKWQHRGPSKAPVDAPQNNPWITTPLFDFVTGIYDGGYQQNVYDQKKEYQPEDWAGDIDHSVTHTRRVLYLRPYYALVLDTVDGTGTHTIDSHFNVGAPAVRIDPSTLAAFSQNKPEEAQIALYPLDRDNLQTEVIQGQHGAPDIKWDVPTVQFRKQQQVPAVLATLLYPYKGDAPKFASDPCAVTGYGAWGQHLRTSLEDVDIAMEKSGKPGPLAFPSALDGNVRVTAAGFVLRRLAGTSDVYLGGWDVSSLQTRSLQLTTDAPANLLVRLNDGKPTLYNGSDRPIVVKLQKPFQQTFTIASSAAATIDANGVRMGVEASVFRLPDPTASDGTNLAIQQR